MTGSSEAVRVAPVHEPVLDLVVQPDEITHAVCCRDVVWKKTFCGYDGDAVNVGATIMCTMCLEWAESRAPGCFSADPIVCPVDDRPCPPEAEIDQRIARDTRPT